MKLKGINPIEQHIEKLVLGLMGLVFVGVLAMQFLISPNEVEYERQNIPPDRVLTRLGDHARGIHGQMISPEPSRPEVATPDLTARFERSFSEPLLRADRLAGVSLGRPFELAIAEVQALDGPVTPLELPAPTGVLFASHWSTVDPFFADTHPEIRPYLPDSQPLDKVTVSVELPVNGKAIRQALEQAGEGQRAIPSHWWSNGGVGLVEVLSVELERQERDHDGMWSEPERVEQVRWTPDALGALNETAPEGETVTWGSIRLADLIAMAGMAQDDPSLVSQPMYLPSIAGVEWVPPSKIGERAADLDRQSKIDRLEREIARLRATVEQVRDQQQGRTGRQAATPGRDPRSGGGGSSLIIGGGGTPSAPSSRTPRADPLEKRIESLNSQIAAKEDELDALFAAGGDDPASTRTRRQASPRIDPMQDPGGGFLLGGDPRTVGDPRSSRPTAASRRATRAQPSGVVSPGPLLDQENYSVWAHDLTATPGAVYRYRIRYAVNNPLFGRERSLGSDNPSLLALAKQPLVRSPWSDWTQPVNVGRTSYFFVTSAREEGQLSQRSSSATAEVYRMFYGYYRKHTITLEPGDPVQGEFRLPDNLPLIDVRSVDAASLEAYFAEREGSDRAIGSQTPADPPEDRPWLRKVPTRLSLTVDAVMLDVAEYPLIEEAAMEGGQPRRLFEVFFYDPLSGVVARRPDRDRGMGEYTMVEQSARLSESGEVRRPDPTYVP